MEPLIAVIAAVVGYLFGSLSFARIVARIVNPDIDISEGVTMDLGDGQSAELRAVAGTAVASRLGDRYGCIAGIGDILKAVIPALALRLLYPDPATPYYLIAAFTAVVGHDWPIYHKFKGGQGLSPITGGFLVMDPIGTIVTSVLSTVLGLVVIKGTWGIFLAYTGMMWLMIPWSWFVHHDLARVIYVFACVLLFNIATIPDIRGMLERQREGVELDMDAMLQMIPMGRGLERMKGMFTRGKDSEPATPDESPDVEG